MRYAAFAFDEFYPSGGWNDIVCLSADLDTAKLQAKIVYDAMRPASGGAWHVVDLSTGKVIAEELYGACRG